MPFGDAAGYRFNPFDLTKVWPHADYPLIRVGRMVLDRNPDNYFAEIEQSTFEPSNMVPGHRPVARQDAARPAVQLSRHPPAPGGRQCTGAPGQPSSVTGALLQPGRCTCATRTLRTRCTRRTPSVAPRHNPNGSVPIRRGAWTERFVRAAYDLHAEDDDFGQAGTLVRDVLDDAARERLVSNIVTHIRAGVVEPVLSRVKEYWQQVDPDLGARIAKELDA